MPKIKSSLPVIAGFIAVLIILSNFIVPATAYAEGVETSALDQMSTVSFMEDPSLFANPERGWFRSYETDDMWDVDKIRAQGITMVLLKCDLKNFKTGPISDAKLQEIRNSFNLCRRYGLQVIFRAAYDFDGVVNCEPTNLSIITGHIGQLKSIFYENEDVLYCVQAGFLGPWGEWHRSVYGNPPSLLARKTVVFALLDAVPPSRSVQVRRPMFIRDIFAGEPGGSALTPELAFSQSRLARTGYHDDALLSTADENGTYVDPLYNRQAELDWANNHNRYTPFVAESDMLTSYSDPGNAVYEMNKLHIQVLNALYHPDVISKWKATTYNSTNTYTYITQRLGYRLVLLDAGVNASVRRGGAMHLSIRMKNDGFGNLINRRNLQVVLSNGQQSYTATVNDDPRKWYRENGVMTKDWYFSIPSGMEGGSWSVYLNLPSAYSAVAGNPMYSVRFANAGIWVAEKGYNLLKDNVLIGSSTGNEVSEFRQITRAEAEQLSMEITPSATPEQPTATVSPEVTPTPSPTATASEPPTAEPTVTASPTQSPAPTATASPAGFADEMPNGITATPIHYSKISVSWSAVSGATAYEVYRSNSSTGTYQLLTTTRYTSYSDRSVNPGTAYFYKVRAKKSGNITEYSRYSEVASAKTSIGTVKKVTASKRTSTSINLDWDDVEGTTRYEIWSATSSSGKYVMIKTSGESTEVIRNLKTGKKYYFKVRAYRLVGSTKVYGNFSGAVSAIP